MTYTTAAVTHNVTVTADYDNVTVVTVVPGLVAGTTYDITSAACSQGECSEETVAVGDTTTCEWFGRQPAAVADMSPFVLCFNIFNFILIMLSIFTLILAPN